VSLLNYGYNSRVLSQTALCMFEVPPNKNWIGAVFGPRKWREALNWPARSLPVLGYRNTINNMTSAGHHGDGMQLMGMKGTLVVRYNTVWDCTQDIYCDDYSQPAGSQPWGDVYIYNNVVYNTKPGPRGKGGFWNGIVTGTGYNSWRSLTVCHNTLVNCNDGSGGVSVAVVGLAAGKIGAVRVLNNLFYNSTNNVAVGSLASRGEQNRHGLQRVLQSMARLVPG
jgi:hypothetical protein